MNQCTWRSDLWSTLSDNHHLPISFISLAFLVFEFLVMVMSFAISDKTRRWVSNLNLSWQGMIDKQFLLTYYQYKERCFLSCHERGTKKKNLSPHEESNLKPSNSVLRCSTTEPQRLHGERGLVQSWYYQYVGKQIGNDDTEKSHQWD